MKTKLTLLLQQHKRTLLALPLLVVPFICMAFWSLRPKTHQPPATELQSNLPEASFPKSQPNASIATYNASPAEELPSAIGVVTDNTELSSRAVERQLQEALQVNERERNFSQTATAPAVQDPAVLYGQVKQLISANRQSAAPDPGVTAVTEMLDKILEVQKRLPESPHSSRLAPADLAVWEGAARDSLIPALWATVAGRQRIGPGDE